MNNTIEKKYITFSHCINYGSNVQILELISIILVVMSYFTSKYLMVLAAAILSIYIY